MTVFIMVVIGVTVVMVMMMMRMPVARQVKMVGLTGQAAKQKPETKPNH